MPPVPEGLAAALSDRYRLARELGAGGMATVYLAEDLKHPRQVAIKVLRPDLAQAIGPERFLREVGIAARLSHPHIVGLIDSGEAGGFLYYVMPYVEGLSLRQKLVREGELPIPEAVRILRDLADALAHAHRQGVVHRDIKPENVMLVERHALVMDFGVAKAVAEGKEGGSSSLTSAGVALGTPAYMAPEQAAGEGQVDARADLYAWGIVAYELLAGQPPFVRATPQNTLAAHVTATPEPVTHHRANVPGALARLVMQCLEKKPADRPQSAEEVLRQLDQVLTPSGGMTATDTRPHQTAGMRRARQRTLLTGAAMVAGLAVIGVLGWRGWQGRAAPIVADRVLVAPLEAQGEQFQPLGRDLSGLATVIAREGLGTPVPAATVRDMAAVRSDTPARQVEYLGNRTGAGLVLRTSCTPQGNGAACQLELFRRPGNVLRMSVPVTGSALDSAFSARLQEQALVLLLLQQRWGERARWEGEYISPSLAASRAFIRGFEAYARSFADTMAAHWYREAERLDPEWLTPVAFGTRYLVPSERDSVLKALALRGQPQKGERETLEWFLANDRGDWEGTSNWSQSRSLANPELFLLWSLASAVFAGRPSRAVPYAPLLDSIGPALEDFNVNSYAFLGGSFHHLGRYRDELQLASRMESRIPEAVRMRRSTRVRAFAGLGDVEGVRRVLAESEGAVQDAGSVGTMTFAAGIELAAHGRAEEGAALLRESLSFYRRAREERGDVTWVDNEVQALRWTGALDSAEALIRRLLLSGKRPDLETMFLGGLGVIAAQRGQRAQALSYSRRLEVPASRSDVADDAAYYRAGISAQLGDMEEAVRLLQGLDRRNERFRFGWMHRDLDLAPLWGYPPFEALLRPKE